MKTKIIVASFVGLIIALTVCISSLQQTKRQLGTAQVELETRKEIWGKLKNIADMYKGGVNISILEDKKDFSASLLVRHSDWQAGARYEFANDGKSVKTFLSEEKEVGWIFIPGRSLKQKQ